jgi:hypothetical protein
MQTKLEREKVTFSKCFNHSDRPTNSQIVQPIDSSSNSNSKNHQTPQKVEPRSSRRINSSAEPYS